MVVRSFVRYNYSIIRLAVLAVLAAAGGSYLSIASGHGRAVGGGADGCAGAGSDHGGAGVAVGFKAVLCTYGTRV